ncbi:MAG: histidine--tRNA ligase [Euryhalocaulis sp.]|uniref:histidine--tRNA ligase n=1 Tax=Euryhalocaulis sp. TaxID=2744307 RepID=UPI00184060F1|nr:histidine--tRNA ligase [Euryhalocaulis sp.]MBA4801753.1 histidine--tRNA ligase [Euryhalocaulis sp.]
MAKKDKPFRPKARRPRGFEDRPADILKAERGLVARAGEVYEAHGFMPLATGAFEYADALGKFLPDEERPNEGVFALQDDDEQWMALRYDMTAPLARYVAENFDGLAKPYRRWQAGSVWRNEKPGPGRFREFTQCDADSVGAPGPEADAEMVMLAAKVMEAAGLGEGDFVVRVNDRRLLDGVLDLAGVGDAAQKGRVLRSLDKLDKFGWDGVAQLLGGGRKDESGDFTEGARLDDAQIEAVKRFTEASSAYDSGAADPAGETIRALGAALDGSQQGEAGVAALGVINDILKGLDFGPAQFRIDTSVVRGLGYYTGTVFEAELLKTATYEDGKPIQFGSVGGGGRYDDLVSRFKGQPVPATGFSFGVSRFAAALRALESGEASKFGGPVVVLALEDGQAAEYFGMAAEIREKLNVPAEVYVGSGRNFGKQLKYADKRGAPVAVIVGSEERENGQVTIKDLALGAKLSAEAETREEWLANEQQKTVPRGEMIETISRALSRMKDQ